MPLPPDFQFSQASLQDYVECRRRFQLRYLLQLQWPAPEAEPAEELEQHMLDGATFHRLIHQHRLGIPAEQLAPDADGPLAEWWAAYLASPPPDLPERQHPELMLSAPIGEHRLVAKIDLLAIDPGRRAVIADWKTSKRQAANWLAARLQTRVYRYVLAQAGAHLNDGADIAPEQIRSVYWFAVDPEHPESIGYDAAQMAADQRYLEDLVRDDRRLDGRRFPEDRGRPPLPVLPVPLAVQPGDRGRAADRGGGGGRGGARAGVRLGPRRRLRADRGDRVLEGT